MGGDLLAGTSFVDAFKIFEEDERTEGMIMVGEIGGRAEEDAAEWIMDYRKRTTRPKPIMGLVAGTQAPPGRIMGHAGAVAASGELDAAAKVRILGEAGVITVDHPEKFGPGMKQLLGSAANKRPLCEPSAFQKRAFHTARQRRVQRNGSKSNNQRRTFYIKQSQAFDILNKAGVKTNNVSNPCKTSLLAMSIDRAEQTPCIISSPSTDPKDVYELSKKFRFAYGSDASTSDVMLEKISTHLSIRGVAQKSLSDLISVLDDLFMSKEAHLLETKISIVGGVELLVHEARFGFDEAPLKIAGRQSHIHALRDRASEVAEEVMAEKSGMIYVKLAGEGSLGTIVNGAGLAMNTIDSLTCLGGHPANFLDTGGKATSNTIKTAFEIVCSDQRVKAIFVNIFGGLTRCDMIAEGIMLAFKELKLQVPVVVRLRGTNEDIGQKMVSFLLCPSHG